jgi:hypothetical protein
MHKNDQPASFGDRGTRHAVNVFVFRYTADGPEYLLLQSGPKQESLWRPIVRPIAFREDLRRTALEAVKQQTGFRRACELFAPAPGIVEDIGDLRLVEWPMAFLPHQDLPHPPENMRAEWWDFPHAMAHLGLSSHRQNLLQLHWRLCA